MNGWFVTVHLRLLTRNVEQRFRRYATTQLEDVEALQAAIITDALISARPLNTTRVSFRLRPPDNTRFTIVGTWL